MSEADLYNQLLQEYQKLKVDEALRRFPETGGYMYLAESLVLEPARRQFGDFCAAQGHDMSVLNEVFQREDLALSNMTVS